MQQCIHRILIFSLAIVVSMAYAAPDKPVESPPLEKISLYQQPDIKSAVSGTVAPNQAIMPIFTQGDWTKVADPSNGNVGWVSHATLKKYHLPYVKALTQSINSPDAVGYKVVQYVGSTALDEKQLDDTLKQWQAQRQQMQTMFNQVWQQNLRLMETMTKQLQEVDFQLPFLMPISRPMIFVPDKSPEEKNASVPTAKQVKSGESKG